MKRPTCTTAAPIILTLVLLSAALAAASATAASDGFAVAGSDLVISLVNQDPDPTVAGDIVELRIGVQNNGNSATGNLVVETIAAYPFAAVAGEESVQRIGTLNAYQTGSDQRIVKFKLRVDKDATKGDYGLKVLLYKDGERESSSTELTLPVAVGSRENAEVIYIDQVELLPGAITPMTFTINNVGSAPLRDLTFSWENGDDVILPVGSDNTKYVKYIDVGESAQLSYNVIASSSATPDLYKLTLSLTYQDSASGTSETITTFAGVYVGGGTDFDLAYSGVSNGLYSFSVSNIGSVAASSVTVRVPQQPGWRVSGSNAVIIGNLNQGDYTIASFSLQQLAPSNATAALTGTTSGDGQGSPRGDGFRNGTGRASNMSRTSGQALRVEIAYTDTRGNRETVTKDVSLGTDTNATGIGFARGGAARTGQTSAPASTSIFSSTNIGIACALVLVVCGLIVRKRYKRGQLEDPDYSYGDAIRSVVRKKRRK